MKFSLFKFLSYFYLEKSMTNGIDQQESAMTIPDDIYLEEKITDINSSEDNISDIQNNGEDIPIVTDEIPQ